MDQPILVVGQGLAGSMISFLLHQQGIQHHVMDPNLNNATKVSSGLINPITGRRYVKSWLIDDLLATALYVYRDIEKLLGVSILHETMITRGLRNTKEENDWNARVQDAHYQEYMGLANPEAITNDKFKSLPSYGEVLKGLRIDLKRFVVSYRHFLAQKNLLIEQEFVHEKLLLQNDNFKYGDQHYSKVVFCEGWKVKHNPYFNHLAFDPAKGEVLIIKVPNLNLKIPYKNQIFLVPLGDDLYWAGSTYEWQIHDDEPTEEKRQEIISKLDAMLDVPYHIINQISGVRPATKFRKPILGAHPDQKGLYLFNGLGTKGASLAPYFGKQMIDLIVTGEKVLAEVDLIKCMSKK